MWLEITLLNLLPYLPGNSELTHCPLGKVIMSRYKWGWQPNQGGYGCNECYQSVDSNFQVLPTRRHQSPRIKPKQGHLSGRIHPIELYPISTLEMHAICALYENSLVLLKVIMCQWSRLTLIQVMAYYIITPGHYLKYFNLLAVYV